MASSDGGRFRNIPSTGDALNVCLNMLDLCSYSDNELAGSYIYYSDDHKLNVNFESLYTDIASYINSTSLTTVSYDWYSLAGNHLAFDGSKLNVVLSSLTITIASINCVTVSGIQQWEITAMPAFELMPTIAWENTSLYCTQVPFTCSLDSIILWGDGSSFYSSIACMTVSPWSSSTTYSLAGGIGVTIPEGYSLNWVAGTLSTLAIPKIVSLSSTATYGPGSYFPYVHPGDFVLLKLAYSTTGIHTGSYPAKAFIRMQELV
jgi:hypothetical protein